MCCNPQPFFLRSPSLFSFWTLTVTQALRPPSSSRPEALPAHPASVFVLAQCRWCFCFHSVIFLFLIRILFLCLKKVSVSTQWSGVQSPWPFSCSSRDQPAFCRLSSTLQYPCRNRCTLAPNWSNSRSTSSFSFSFSFYSLSFSVWSESDFSSSSQSRAAGGRDSPNWSIYRSFHR